MEKITKIMLATDFSDCADNALQYAMKIAHAGGGKLSVLNAYEVPVVAPVNVFTTLEDTVKVVSQDMKASSTAKLRRLQSDINNLQVTTATKEGRPSQTIKEQVLTDKPDLLVMGTRGINADRGLFMGSTAVAVMREVSCPLLAVPKDARNPKISKIAYATDLKYDETSILEYVIKFAAVFSAEVVILHIDKQFDDSEWRQDLMQDLKAGTGYDKVFYRDVVNDNTLEGINEFVEEYGVDILATTTSNTSLFERLLNKSVTKELLMHTHIPMLIFNRKKHDMIFFS